MADTLDGGEFWLPSEFLTDDDIRMDKENFNKNSFHADFLPNFCFPTKLGLSGSSSVLSSPVESVVGSTETDSDEDDLLAGLTHRFACSTLTQYQKIAPSSQNFEKAWVFAGSPKSTLSAAGSWSGRGMVSSNKSPSGPSQVPSPPTSSFGANNDAWDLIYQAAGQIANLKMSAEVASQNGGLIGPQRNLTSGHPSLPAAKNPPSGFGSNDFLAHTIPPNSRQMEQRQVLKQPSYSIWGSQAKERWFSQPQPSQNSGSAVYFGVGAGVGGSGEFSGSGRYPRPLGLPQSSWPPLHVQNQQPQHSGSSMRAVLPGRSAGSGMKRECAGTGVFLPRRYANTSTDFGKKPGGSPAVLPARAVQAVNKKLDYAAAYALPQYQQRLNGPFISDYDMLLARRNALMAQQRRSSIRPEGGAMNHEKLLPQEWTY